MASEWKVGDLVVFNEPEKDSKWQGGRGKVTEVLVKPEFSVRVLVLDVPPPVLESPHYRGTTQNMRPADLLPYGAEEAPSTQPEMVEHPKHYGGKDDPYEVIKVAEAWGLDKDAYLFNVLKYIARAGKKGSVLEDLRKGHFYLGRKITNLVKETAK